MISKKDHYYQRRPEREDRRTESNDHRGDGRRESSGKYKILIGEVESVDISEEFAHEKLSPVLAMYKRRLSTRLLQSGQLVADGGYGHTSSLYINTNEKEKMAKHAAAMRPAVSW